MVNTYIASENCLLPGVLKPNPSYGAKLDTDGDGEADCIDALKYLSTTMEQDDIIGEYYWIMSSIGNDTYTMGALVSSSLGGNSGSGGQSTGSVSAGNSSNVGGASGSSNDPTNTMLQYLNGTKSLSNETEITSAINTALAVVRQIKTGCFRHIKTV